MGRDGQLALRGGQVSADLVQLDGEVDDGPVEGVWWPPAGEESAAEDDGDGESGDTDCEVSERPGLGDRSARGGLGGQASPPTAVMTIMLASSMESP